MLGLTYFLNHVKFYLKSAKDNTGDQEMDGK